MIDLRVISTNINSLSQPLLNYNSDGLCEKWMETIRASQFSKRERIIRGWEYFWPRLSFVRSFFLKKEITPKAPFEDHERKAFRLRKEPE